MRDLLKTFKHAPLWKKLLIIVIFLAALIGLILGAILSIGNIVKVLKMELVDPNQNYSLFYYALETRTGKPLTIVTIIAILFIVFYVIVSNGKKNFTDGKDEEGIHYMEQQIFGSARMMDKAEAEKEFTVCHAKDAINEIYGQFTDLGEETVSYKKPENKAEKNRNICIVGPSGSGKSYSASMVHLLQHIKAHHSCVITDPGGNIYGQTHNFFESQGIKNYCINLADSSYSDSWDCLKECADTDTGRLSEKRLRDFAQTFMANVGNASDDVYFFQASVNLLMLLIGYTAYWHEEAIIGYYKKLYLTITNKKYADWNNDEFMSRVETEYISFKWCRQKIMDAALDRGYSPAYIDNLFNKIEAYAEAIAPFTLAELNKYVADFAYVEARLDPSADKNMSSTQEQLKIPKWHPAYMSYVTFKTQSDKKVRSSAVQGLQMAFNIFTNKKLETILSEKGVDLRQVNKEPSVVYVITSDKSNETKPIASLFFSFMFYDIQDEYDKQQQLTLAGLQDNNPCVPVAIILDDFFSLGLISGDAETFAGYMSDARKRKLYIELIIQNYMQFEAIYGKEFVDSIQGNCSTLLCLGANDYNTAKFVSDMCGTATKLNTRHQEIDNPLSMTYVNAGVTIQSAEAALIPPGDVLKIDNQVLVKRQGLNHILMINPMPWVQLPIYTDEKNKEFWKTTSVYKSIKSYEEKHPWIAKTEGQINQEYQNTVDKLLAHLVLSKSHEIDFETGDEIKNKASDLVKPDQSQNYPNNSFLVNNGKPLNNNKSSSDEEGANTSEPNEMDINFDQL